MSKDAATLGSGRAYEAARLRWAGEADAARLAALWRAGRDADGADPSGEDEARMRAWLADGGAVVLEDDRGEALCALRWRWQGGGWHLDRIATRPDARGQGFGRWLMTKLEALAIKRAVPHLTLDLPADHADLRSYYVRLGYRDAGTQAGAVRMRKRVGGVWQRQTDAAPHEAAP